MAQRFPIAVAQEQLPVDRPTIRRLARAVLAAEGMDDYRVSLVFVDNDEILSINRRFLDHDYVTDVIAFPLEDDLDAGGESPDGELVISAEKAVDEAAARGEPPEHELMRYVVHGLLHLAGHDDLTEPERRAMWARQEDLLRAFLNSMK